MRILIVSTHYPPQQAIASQRVHAHATTWAELGAEVTVLTSMKQDDQRGAPASSPGIRVEEVAFAPSRFIRWARASAGERGLRDPGALSAGARRGIGGRALVALRERAGVYAGIRMPDVSDAWVRPAVRRAEELGREEPFDAVFASSGPYTTLRVADRLREAGAARCFIAEFRDLWTANHSARGVFPITVRERAIERRILRRADRIITVSDGLARWLRDRATAPVDVIYNGHAGRRGEAGSGHPRDAFVLAYTGAVYERGHDLNPLMRALAILRDVDRALYNRTRLVVAGGSGGAFRAAAGSAGVEDRLELLGPLSHDRALAVQDQADALVSLEWVGRAEGVLTGKLFEYLAGTKPILVIGPPREIAELVTRCGRGVHAGAGPRDVAEAIRDIASGRASVAGAPDVELIETLSRRNQSKRLYGIIERCAASAARAP